MLPRFLKLAGPAGLALVVAMTVPARSAETLRSAMAAAYANNADLNADRAELRATDEGVPQALSGYRPSVSAGASATLGGPLSANGAASLGVSLSLSLEQAIFDGYRTPNGVKAAETAVFAARELLRNTEQTTLLNAVGAFTNVVRDQATLGLSQQNAEFLSGQVTAARDRVNVGEGTQTEVQQANARQAAAQSSVAAAIAGLTASAATFEQVTGRPPRNLAAAAPIDRGLPASPEAASADALANHPAIKAALYNVDVALLNVKIAEGAFLPSFTVQAGLSQSLPVFPATAATASASVTGRLSVPLYSGGRTDSQVRAAKERLGQREIEVDVTRAQIRANALNAFAQLQSARAQITSAELQVSAAQLALEGIIEERNVGQRTTLDVLDAQADVLTARTALVRAQRDRVFTSYALLAAVGRLTAEQIGLEVTIYRPEEHYVAVRDLWGGLRTPDGR